MAKQASKAKPTAAKRRGAASRAASKAPAARRRAAESEKNAASAGRKPRAATPAGASKRTPSTPTKAGAPTQPRTKPAKLQAVGKALTSGHAASGRKAGSDGAGPAKNKKKAGLAPRSATGGKAAGAKRAAPSKSAPKKPRAAKRVAFDRKTLASIKKSLKDQRQDLIDQLEDIEEAAFSPSQTEASGEAGFDEDYADAGTATFEREKDLSIANNINNLVDKIDKALEKIEQGTYGICENCGQPISADRLKALPHVLLCINCKKAEERR